MYRELDNLLSEESTVDSWYDDGFLIAQSIMNDFSKDDWEKLSNDILNKDLEWKKKLVYCLDNQIIQEELEIIGKLLHNEMGHSYIKMHPEIIKEAKERMDTAGNATKRMLQCFLEVFNIL